MKHILTLVLLLTPLAALHAADSSKPAKPNIIYFLVDDMGYADCGFNGGKDIRTPNIDRLAKQGTVLTSFYVQPLCSPTRAALLSGRYPTHTGVYNVVTPGAAWGLPLDERTLPQALGEAGYTTAICGKWHLGEFRAEYRPSQRGFQHQYGHMMGNLDYNTHLRDGKLDWYRDGQPLQEEGCTTRLIAKEASRLIREQPADKPLFLYVAFNGIHSPYQVPDNRMALGFEYTAKYNPGHDVPYEPCRSFDSNYFNPSIPSKDRGRFAPIHHRIVYHYHGRKGPDMPFSREVAVEKQTGSRSGGGHVPWGALMFSELPKPAAWSPAKPDKGPEKLPQE